MSQEKELTPGHQVVGKKLMLRIWIGKDGGISIESAFREKTFIVQLLTDSLKIANNLKNNVVKVPRNLSPGGLKNFISRHMGKSKKKKANGAFGGSNN